MSDIQIYLTPSQITELTLITNNRTTNFPEGYRYIYGIIKDNPNVNSGTKYWFKKASEINGNHANSLANTFIRSVTNNGFIYDGIYKSPDFIQSISNNIAHNVLTDIHNLKGIPQLDLMLKRDIDAALQYGNQTIGGWGGSFYYWDMPYKDGKTVGQYILSNPREKEKFLTTAAMTVSEIRKQFLHMSVSDIWEILKTTMNADVPTKLAIEIILRSSSGKYTGNSNIVDGWYYDTVNQRWVKEIYIGADSYEKIYPDEETVNKLNVIRQIRIKAEDRLQEALSQYCFAAETPILMSDGTYKPIEKIKIGDEVMAFDGLGELQPRKVTQTFITPDQEVVQLGNIKVTLGHHFLQPDGSFKALGEIDTNSFLVGVTGKLISHPGIQPVAGKHTVYNFTVEELHTYIAGDYRVHNESLSLYQPVTTGGFIGASVGSQIGAYFASDKFASQLVAQSLGKTVGSWVGDAIVYEFDLSNDPAFLARAEKSLSLAALYKRLPGSFISTGISLGSSKLANSLIKAFKIEDPLTQIGVNTLVSGTVSHVIAQQVAQYDQIVAATFFGAPPKVVAGKVVGVDFNQLKLGNTLVNMGASALGSFVGSQLYQAAIQKWNILSEDFSIQGAGIGATLGGLGAGFGTSSIVAGLGLAGTAFAGPLGYAVFSAIGTLLGSIFGGALGDRQTPRAAYTVTIENGIFVAKFAFNLDGGSTSLAQQMGNNARDILNFLASSVGGKASPTGNIILDMYFYGHYKNSYFYKDLQVGADAAGGSSDWRYPYRYGTAQDAIINGIIAQIKAAQFEGGDLYIKRLLKSLPTDVKTIDKLNADFQVAREWGIYKDNSVLYEKNINYLKANAIQDAETRILDLRSRPQDAFTPSQNQIDPKIKDFNVNFLPSKITLSLQSSDLFINGEKFTNWVNAQQRVEILRFADGSRFKIVVNNGLVKLEDERVANWQQIQTRATQLKLDTPNASDSFVNNNASRILGKN